MGKFLSGAQTDINPCSVDTGSFAVFLCRRKMGIIGCRCKQNILFIEYPVRIDHIPKLFKTRHSFLRREAIAAIHQFKMTVLRITQQLIRLQIPYHPLRMVSHEKYRIVTYCCIYSIRTYFQCFCGSFARFGIERFCQIDIVYMNLPLVWPDIPYRYFFSGHHQKFPRYLPIFPQIIVWGKPYKSTHPEISLLDQFCRYALFQTLNHISGRHWRPTTFISGYRHINILILTENVVIRNNNKIVIMFFVATDHRFREIMSV